MRKFASIFGILCGLIFTNGVTAQELKVTCHGSDKPIGAVYVYDQTEKKTATTNENGIVKLDEFAMEDTIFFQHASYDFQFATKQELKDKGYKMQLLQSVYQITQFEIVTLRDEEEPDDLPYPVTSIEAREIALNNPQNSADMLQMSGDVQVQKSQMGGGSPIIRGFEANKILMVVDGVRMNNAIYRSGHLQNAITVDANMLERTEVLFGPGSMIYGSDALGGVIHFHTRTPKLGEPLSVNTMLRTSTANQEKTLHYDMSTSRKKWGFLTSFTVSEFGDLRMGANRTHGYDDWGKIPYYVSYADGFDTVLANPNDNVHKRTGYQQMDLMQKILFQPNDSLKFILNTQFSTSSDVPRFDRLNEYRDGQLRFAEWYYGPQQRLLTSLKTSIKSKSRFFNTVNLIAAYQRIDEDRANRRLRRAGKTLRFEDVNVYSFNADFVRQIDTSKIFYYGVEATHNDVKSTAFEEDIYTGERSPSQTRYPDGGSSVENYALYLNYNWQFSPLSTLNAGVRYSHSILTSEFNDTTFLTLPFNNIDFNNGAFTGSLSYILRPNDGWKISTILSSGYRSPNVDDYGKVFERNGFVVVPNNQLRPEYAYNAELGLTKRFFKKSASGATTSSYSSYESNDPGASTQGEEWLAFNASVYYTYLVDAIVRTDWRLNDADSLLYEGELARIQTNINANEAEIYGYSLKMRMTLRDHWKFSASYNYTFGTNLSLNTPMAHIPPVFGRVGFMYQTTNTTLEAYTMFNGWKRVSRYDPTTTTDNLVQATEDGTPPWYTLNARATFNLRDALQLQFGLENILDTHYKTFASGISAPGRNFMVAVRANLK